MSDGEHDNFTVGDAPALGIVARCARCGGWTMFHGSPESDTAKEWAVHCTKQGDIVSTMTHERIRALKGCADSWGNTGPAHMRTCEVVEWQVAPKQMALALEEPRS